MAKRFWVGLALLLVVPGFMFAASCAQKQIKSEPAITPVEEKTEAKDLEAEREARARQKALEEQRLREERLRAEAKASRERAERERAEKNRFVNEHIHFEFDKSRLVAKSRSILRWKAKWLAAHPDVSVIIEGHCDERGTNGYNMALGDRRARSAKNYLVDLGISSERLTTISYGEEKPLDRGHNERAWARNRRDQFVIE